MRPALPQGYRARVTRHTPRINHRQCGAWAAARGGGELEQCNSWQPTAVRGGRESGHAAHGGRRRGGARAVELRLGCADERRCLFVVGSSMGRQMERKEKDVLKF
jgi:hypothetical protein